MALTEIGLKLASATAVGLLGLTVLITLVLPLTYGLIDRRP